MNRASHRSGPSSWDAFRVGSRVLQDRIYLNDGNGNFTRRLDALPENGNNTSVVIPLDIDKDGDLDLFVGSRSIPINYGVPPQSYIYENIGNAKFKDATIYFAPFLQTMGMITDATLTNIMGDETKELIIVGEWMSPVILKINRGKFEKVNSNIQDYSGWWYAIESEDIDGDGDQDLILGNRGDNFYFTGTNEKPAKLWLWDFDNNGTIEKIITRQVDGRDMTVALKKELLEQVTSLGNQDFTHSEFAGKSMQELFAKELLDQALVSKGTWFKSSIALNNGSGNFIVKALPREIQFSSINAIMSIDLNGDNKKDLILGGNDSGFMPQYSKLDASFGHILINTGNGNYKMISSKKSGFFVKGDIRNFIRFKLDNKECFLTLINNQTPKMYELIHIENDEF